MLPIISKLIGKSNGQKQAEKESFPSDFNDLQKEIIPKVRPFTMTSNERIATLIDSVQYITRNNIEGAIVECGVWKGGSMMAVGLSLLKDRSTERQLYLYDTFEGMPPAEEVDRNFKDLKAETLLQEDSHKKQESVVWAYSSLEDVQKNIATVHYPEEKIRYIKGKVEDTIPFSIPDKIALLRLDTDWYQSTKHELEHLYPLLVKGGVLIIDDYGFWKGAKKAVDEYFSQFSQPFFLSRIDDTGRILIKP